MTLGPIPGAFRPGAPTSPQAQAQAHFIQAALEAHLKFLTAEERATATLMGFYQEARLDLESFIRTGDLSVSDATFYRQLLDETNRVGSKLNTQGAEWVSGTIPEGYSAGWRANSSTIVPQGALEALSRESMSLIRETTDGMRAAVRQSIAAGILQGLSGEDVRQRILASGLTNIPHWPSVEYRAGVIARTETMRAYNAGTLDGIVDNGARFAVWMASPDEATCKICLPRDEKTFRIGAAPEDFTGDPYPAAQPLPHLPAHPRCRCTIRAQYRGPDGQVIRAQAPETAPKLPDDAMGGKDEPTLPPAAGDMKKAFGKLTDKAIRQDLDDAFTANAVRALPESLMNAQAKTLLAQAEAAEKRIATLKAQWRGFGKLSDDELRLLTHGLTGTKGNEAFRNFLELRFGINFPAKKFTGWLPELRFATLRSLEALREMNPAFVVDSPFLNLIGDRPIGARNFGKNVIARAFASGQVEGNMRSWGEYAKPGAVLRGGADVNPAEEVIMHEFLHTVHNRFGLHDASFNRDLNPWVDRYKAVEAVDGAWHAEYKAIRGASSGVSPTESTLSRLRDRVADYKAKIAANGPNSFYSNMISNAEQQIADMENPTHEFFPTEYGKTSYAEDFAESGMLYMLDPGRLKRYSPKRYAFLRDRVFGGKTK